MAFDWGKLAERVADDLATGALAQAAEPVVIPARWYPRASAARFARAL